MLSVVIIRLRLIIPLRTQFIWRHFKIFNRNLVLELLTHATFRYFLFSWVQNWVSWVTFCNLLYCNSSCCCIICCFQNGSTPQLNRIRPVGEQRNAHTKYHAFVKFISYVRSTQHYLLWPVLIFTVQVPEWLRLWTAVIIPACKTYCRFLRWHHGAYR